MSLDRRLMSYALFLAASLLVLLVVYGPSMQGEFLASDFRVLVHNIQMQGLAGLASIWVLPPSPNFPPMDQYQPLTYSLWWVERRVFGLDPRLYQALSVALHALNTLLVWRLLARVGVRGAALAAALFALHPIQVESVAWVYEQKNPLSGVTFFLSLHAYLNWKSEGRSAWYAAALGLFGLGLLTKASVVVLPALLLLYAWHQRESLRPRALAPLLPFFALGGAMALLTIWYETSVTGAHGDLFSAGLLERFGRAGWVTGFNVSKILIPANLAFLYPRWEFRTSNLAAYLPNLAIATGLGLLWWRRESWGRPALLGVGFFLVLLLPVMGFFDIYYHQFSLVADHFQYLPSLGLIALCVHGGVALFDRAMPAHESPRRAVGLAASVLLIALFGTLSWQRSHVFASEGLLFRDAADKYPGSWLAFQKTGEYVLKRFNDGEPVTSAELQRAIGDFKHAAAHRPLHPQLQDSLGLAYQFAGELELARRHFETAVELAPENSNYHWNLALLYERLELPKLAVVHYEFAHKARPKSVDNQFSYARALVRADRLNEAASVLERVIKRSGRKAAEAPRIAEVQRQAMQLEKQVLAAIEAKWGNARTTERDAPPWSVLVVTVDTLRPDYLSANGYDASTSPEIDLLLSEGVYFEQALTPVPRTTPALASLMTGAYPHTTGVRSLASRLPQNLVTLAEAFRTNGHETMAVVTNMMLGSVRGLDAGFDVYDSSPDQRDAERTTDAALGYLEKVPPEVPLFAWVHYIDPHVPYHPTLDVASEFDPEYEGRFAASFGRQPKAMEPSHLFREFPEGLTKSKVTHRNSLTDTENAHIRRLYAGDIRRVDSQIARLVGAVRARFPRTVIVFTADHGESLGEHDFYFDHGDYVYNAGSRVPLAFVMPADHPLHAKARRSGWVSLVDVAPTLLELVDVEAPAEMAALFEGRSLIDHLRGEVIEERPVFIESGTSFFPKLVRRRQENSVDGRFRAVVLGNWKLIWTPKLPESEAYELYDLRRDPNETRNLFTPAHPEFPALKSLLDEWLAAASPQAGSIEAPSEEDIEALRELGYIE